VEEELFLNTLAPSSPLGISASDIDSLFHKYE